MRRAVIVTASIFGSGHAIVNVAAQGVIRHRHWTHGGLMSSEVMMLGLCHRAHGSLPLVSVRRIRPAPHMPRIIGVWWTRSPIRRVRLVAFKVEFSLLVMIMIVIVIVAVFVV